MGNGYSGCLRISQDIVSEDATVAGARLPGTLENDDFYSCVYTVPREIESGAPL